GTGSSTPAGSAADGGHRQRRLPHHPGVVREHRAPLPAGAQAPGPLRHGDALRLAAAHRLPDAVRLHARDVVQGPRPDRRQRHRARAARGPQDRRGGRQASHRLPRARGRRGARAGAGAARPSRERVRGPRRPHRRRGHLGGRLAHAPARVRVRPAHRQLRRGVARHRLPAAALQHRLHRVHRHGRHARLLRDGRLRLRALPAAVQGRPVHGADRHDHLAQAGAARAHLRLLRRHRLDGHLAAPDRAALLRQRLQRLPAQAVLHAAPQGAGRGGDDRRRGAAEGAHLGDRAAVVPGARGRGPVPHRLRLERLLRAAPLHARPAGPAAAVGGHPAVQLHLLAAAAPDTGHGAAGHGGARGPVLLHAALLHARHRHHGRREVRGPRGSPAPGADAEAVAGERFTLGVNYWPRRKAMYWWRGFDAAEVEDDLTLIASLGLDLVRVFLLWDDWQPRPDQVSAERLAELERLCDLAHRRGLGLDVTFFTGHMSGPNWAPAWALVPPERGARTAGLPPRQVVSGGVPVDLGYRDPYEDPLMRAAAETLLTEVVGALRGHPAVRLWNLGNEPDLFAWPATPGAGAAWVRDMTALVKRLDPGTPVTCGL